MVVQPLYPAVYSNIYRVTRKLWNSIIKRIQEFFQGCLYFLSFQGGAQQPLGPENPLKSKDFTGPGGGLAPIAPLNTPLSVLYVVTM